MSPSAVAEAHTEARRRLAAAASLAARRAWLAIDRSGIQASWLQSLGSVLAVVSGAQLLAAQGTEPWLHGLLGDDPDRAESDRLNPAALAGVTGDGTLLAEALRIPMLTALRALTGGAPLVQAMARGQILLDVMVRTAVADAGRAADTVGMAARPAVTSYVRVVESGACSRCIVLAGREYAVSTGFLRHPRCHCGMEPVTREHKPAPSSPGRVVEAMSEEQRRKVFGAAGARAIAQGADVAQVVNARRGMATATAFGRSIAATSEGTVRGEFRRREFRRLQAEGAIPRSQSIRGFRPERARLMPEEIFRQAEDRAHAVRLLRLHGYLT
ncbi:hypothetical protein ACGFS9_03045 [Streptomyces sp. NPDC048566]|uniref:hypothetical protein n=1 Tax=Streptomyces sp. NPDC048566 TaxID=3365569 RepID=UPI0037178CA7